MNYLLLDVESKKVGSFLGFDHSKDSVLIIEKYSNVDLPLMGEGSQNIGYLRNPYYSSLRQDS